MEEVEVLLVNAFTHSGKGGNPAGVVLEADSLSHSDRQKIAVEVGLSETAFVSKSNKADFKVEFFTPTSQVAMCGHATIATWSTLRNKKNLSSGQHTQELMNGVLEVQLQSDGSVLMEQEQPRYGEFIDHEVLAPLLGLDVKDFMVNLKPQLVSTGMFDVMVGVKNVEFLRKIVPDFEAISVFQKKNNESGLHVFALLDNNAEFVAAMRDFCPLLGIPEESATGSATGALLCYLYKHGLVDAVKAQEGIWFQQGYQMNRPSNIFGKLTIANNEIVKIKVGGKATEFGSKKVLT